MAGWSGRMGRREINPWPGYVDALSALIIVTVFVLLIFICAQLTLQTILSGKESALADTKSRLAEINRMLDLETAKSADLDQLVASLRAELDGAAARAGEATAALTLATEREAAGAAALKERLIELAALAAARDRLAAQIKELEGQLAAGTQSLHAAEGARDSANAQLTLLNAELAKLNEKLDKLQALLADKDKDIAASAAQLKARDASIAELTGKLNTALAKRVEELARYRSEFFGRLKTVLGDRPDIRVEGDRFVFQSEVLFPSGSAELNEAGRAELARLAGTLLEITARIPTDLKWILRVDGHTDRLPIRTADFASNWELSAARAIAVVKVLAAAGVPPEHLAAAGFGPFQPIDSRDDEIGWRRNRRIELRLDGI